TQQENDMEFNWARDWWIPAAILLVLIGVIFMAVGFSFLRLWVQCLLAPAPLGILDMIRVKLLGIDYPMIRGQKHRPVEAGIKVTTREMEAHILSHGNVPRVATAVIAAHKAGMDLPWRIAAAIDLAGRNVLEAVQTSVNPKVIDCPNPSKGQATTLDGV